MNALCRLAQAHGIGLRYHDIWGALHDVPADTIRALLRTMGVSASTDEEVLTALEAHESAIWRKRVAPMVVLREDVSPSRVRLHLPCSVGTDPMQMRIVTETGDEHLRSMSPAIAVAHAVVDGEPWRALDVELPLALAAGYHRLAFAAGDQIVAHAHVAVTPARCHRPAALRDGTRAWGAAVQLYGVRSSRNWGIGDFTDLGEIVARCGARGAGIVGVNPLHALFPHDPLHISPYSPSSRLFANPLYLDVEAIADFAECEPARALLANPAFAKRLLALRDTFLVDYPGVAAAKREVLELLYASFRDRHRGRRTSRAARFTAFQREAGEALRQHALFEALQEHFFAQDASVWGWPAWPGPFRDPHSPDVARFAQQHGERVDYYAYLQWQVDLQRAAIAKRADEAGLSIGLYTDLAVSIDRGGAEAWANQTLYAAAASVGAPPDAFNPDGQDWGLPPIVPSRLRAAGYAPFIATLRANMRHAGALRIDHVMGLMRLFWVPNGRTPAEGAYVHYPLDDLVGLLALESQRHRCLVIGEDLGTVPDHVRQTLAERDVLSYRVLMFERDGAGEFKPPEAYPEAALATASTHDLPTLAGWWAGHDIEVRAKLGMLGPEAARLQEERAEDRRRLLRALERAGVLPDDASGALSSPKLTAALAESIAAFLAATPSLIAVLQLEDVVLAREQANLPGTVDAHPNWRRKLPVTIDDALDGEPFRSLPRRLSQVRPPPARPTFAR
jgi:(1->4)-alpha-D-glucan 1-alpha-D-glucosylmutase